MIKAPKEVRSNLLQSERLASIIFGDRQSQLKAKCQYQQRKVKQQRVGMFLGQFQRKPPCEVRRAVEVFISRLRFIATAKERFVGSD
jgi:hypothetical protein